MPLGDRIGIEEGLLSKLGYHVGAEAPIAEDRHEALSRALHLRHLPDDLDEAYRLDWGEPDSRLRYGKIVNVLSVLAASASNRRDGAMDLAIGQWQADLK